MKRQVRVLDDAPALARALAQTIRDELTEAVRTRGQAFVALAGGNTPRDAYALLANDSRLRAPIPWTRMHFFWSDERSVGPDDPESNYKMAMDTLLAKMPVNNMRVYRMEGEDPDIEVAAKRYEAKMRGAFSMTNRTVPRFDLVLLGVGEDGHTASLFPGTTALDETSRWCVANYVEAINRSRLTLTLPVINHANCVVICAQGEKKADIVRRIMTENTEPKLPVQRVEPKRGHLIWLLDQAAASRIEVQQLDLFRDEGGSSSGLAASA